MNIIIKLYCVLYLLVLLKDLIFGMKEAGFSRFSGRLDP